MDKKKLKKMSCREMIIKYGKLMNQGKITRTQYYQIIDLWEGCHNGDLEKNIKKIF